MGISRQHIGVWCVIMLWVAIGIGVVLAIVLEDLGDAVGLGIGLPLVLRLDSLRRSSSLELCVSFRSDSPDASDGAGPAGSLFSKN